MLHDSVKYFRVHLVTVENENLQNITELKILFNSSLLVDRKIVMNKFGSRPKVYELIYHLFKPLLVFVRKNSIFMSR